MIDHQARAELRALIREQLAANPGIEAAADAITALFHLVADDWDEHDVTTIDQMPGTSLLRQRYLVARIPREAQRLKRPAPDRTVGPA